MSQTGASSPAFEIAAVNKSYGGTPAVSDVSLSVPSGSTTVLIGPSGCGKSTLLRLMVGLLAADSGQIRFDGSALTLANVTGLRHRMGYVIQDGGLFPHLTARRNVSLMATHLGKPRAEIDARVAELCSLTQFPADGLDRYPAQLSGGQRQRVSLMRALMLDPDVLLMDEPLGALDPMIRADLQQQLRDIFRSLGKTVVMVTHDLAEARYFGDAIVLLREGKIVQQGSFQSLVDEPAEAFVSDFVRAQQMGREEASA
jgi:osmoprotectant transport system ATP-binding protein